MVLVIRGKKDDGTECQMYVDGMLKRILDPVVHRVKKGNWDYVSIVAGIPGSGKSTFARTIARYCDPTFSLDDICFSAREFIEKTKHCKEYKAVVLDESFESLNTRVTMTPAFLRIVNHLQIIRQKHLFVILCLPNFFDLSKGVAIFRASHLYVTYANEKTGRRGSFLGFGRSEKRRLYVRGGKYMNYNAVRANIVASFTLNKNIMSEKDYEAKKLKHLMEQQEQIEKKEKFGGKKLYDRDKLILKMKIHYTNKELAKLFELTERTIEKILKKEREALKNEEKPSKYP